MNKKVPVKNLNQMRTTRAADKEMFHYLDEKQGSAHDFRVQVERDQWARQRPGYWGRVR